MRSSVCACFVQILTIIGTGALILHVGGCERKKPAVQVVPRAATHPVTAPAVPVAAIDSSRAIDSRAVDQALAKGRAFLYSTAGKGQWGAPEDRQPQVGTKTALVTRALLQSGETLQNAQIGAALRPLLAASFTSTQSVADRLRLEVKLPLDKTTKQLLERDASFLLGSVSYKNGDSGLHPRAADVTEVSLAASAQASTALADAADRQLEIPSTYWKVTDTAWRDLFLRELEKGHAVSPDGLCADDLKPMLRILDVLATTSEESPAAVTDAKGASLDKLLETALKQLETCYIDLYRGPGEFEAIELLSRIMRTRGQRTFAGHDWYRDGASLLLGIQRGDGSWGDGVSDTAYAMLFLSRSRAPVLFNKLQYETSAKSDHAAWNNHPRELLHLTHWLSDQLERPFDWQVLGIDSKESDFATAPILYISGNTLLNFTPEQHAKLKKYIEQGGMIVGNADNNSTSFANSIMKLGQQLFPQFEFRQLPQDHLVFSEHFQVNKAGPKPVIRGLSNGARELMILFPTDQGRFWQMDQFTGGRALPSAEMAANRVLYATDKKFKFKEDFFPHPLDAFPILAQTHPFSSPLPDAAGVRRAAFRNPIIEAPLKSATLAYISSDLDPAALPKFEALREAIKLKHAKLNIDPLILGKFTLQRYETAAVTARQFSSLGALDRLEIKRFIETGGTLYIEAWKDPEKVPAIEAQLSKLFTDHKVTFGPQTPAGTLLPATFEVRIARCADRAAIIINAHPSQSDEILQRLLEPQAK